MAQLSAVDLTGNTLYFIVTDSVGDYWIEAGTANAFENYNAANITTYNVAMVEDAGIGIYRGTFPVEIPVGTYDVTVKRQAGGSPAVGDLVIGVATYAWDGTTLRVTSEVGAWAGTAVTISSTTSKPEVDVFSVSDDATSANNLELQYDTTGLTGDTFPATQVQVGNLLGYMDSIWIDTVGGAAGSVVGTNGIASNPVNNLADAVILAAAIGLRSYRLLGSSAITLVSAHSNWSFVGSDGAVVTLGGQNTNGSHFECTTITGDADGNDISGRSCFLQSLTNLIGVFENCFLVDNITLVAGDHHFFHCVSAVAGTSTPYIDVDGDGVNARNLNLRGWFGGVEIRNHTSADNTSFDCPAGQIVVAASCTGGTIAMRGNINITDNAAGVVTFSENAAVNITKIRIEMDSNSTQLAAIVADTNELQTDWTDGGRLDLLLDDIPNTSEFEARTILAGSYFDPANDTVARVTLVDTTTVNTDMVAEAPTTAAIDVVLTASHGSGDWTTSGGTGSGARAVTITVDDGTVALESAKVRVTKGALTFLSTTDVNGEVNSGSGFSLDDGTWTVTITLGGYSFTPTTLVVAADVDQTYSMTEVAFPASSPNLVTGFLYTYDEDGVVESGVTVEIRFRELAGTGFAYDRAIRTETSDATGLVSFTNLFPGGEYELRRETNGIWTTVTVASDATTPYTLPSFWGID